MKRFGCLLCALALVVGLLAACDKNDPILTSTGNNGTATTNAIIEESSSQTKVSTTKVSTTLVPVPTAGNFPQWGENQYLNLQRTNHRDIAAPKIINAIQLKDVDALEALMCKNIKDNTEDLRGKIDELINAVEGEIISSEWKSMGSYSSSRADGKK